MTIRRVSRAWRHWSLRWPHILPAVRPPRSTVWNRTTARPPRLRRGHGAPVAALSPADGRRERRRRHHVLPHRRRRRVAARWRPDGLLAGLQARSTVLVDCTSGDPPTSRRIAANGSPSKTSASSMHRSRRRDRRRDGHAHCDGGWRCRACSIACVRCSIFSARKSSIAVRRRRRCGQGGEPCHARASISGASAEGLDRAVRIGVKPDVALDVINASSGRSNTSRICSRSGCSRGRSRRTFRLALFDKDVGHRRRTGA